ncbi:5-methylcytosine-specific restriction endonuclease system specificity protein McrC [Methanohalophilus portucalensis]|uniref:5-methylcytosine restriction system component-like protein n=2 Tax=Methanohalophilus portucalensis TaxID=39664 RepID=A0A1L9C2W6_9EURY|nr:5-methylcytosine-specific restriction endonuclease system specificity protein McrC [Methanohalophilus portucalensis]ATU07675.1 5-methylcytosine-specific restriction endonuclease system specificity protein McrC [Methanohalophilus portucalensis]OJH48821.1 5-methylcytosine restriction system component-like protein [Methanohalophilus portucalensis FDF-1]RNI08797.1 5-methylcytosine-specific restriction endonuclease system specificity protein McrC [Methanohalophilus portucalensis FDF-1]SMH36805.1 
MIRVKNIYHMLSYAFQVLNQGSYSTITAEEFEHPHDLLAVILGKGIFNQIRRGLGREYVCRSDELTRPVGKMSIPESIKRQTLINKKLVCEFDEFTENTYLNQILKTTTHLLLRSSDVGKSRKYTLKKVLLHFHNVDDLNPYRIQWTGIKYHRNNSTYKMLINICYLVIKGMLLSEKDGNQDLYQYTDDQYMHRLFEKFVLEYYRKHYPELSVKASNIGWDTDDGIIEFLPTMRSDVTIEYAGRTLIIDTKYYSNMMQVHTLYNTRSQHSSNMYQIYTYVKNRDKEDSGNVSGVLLYAKTDEEITPDNDYMLGGNRISVKTLDLNTEFSNIQEHLHLLITSFYPELDKIENFKAISSS